MSTIKRIFTLSLLLNAIALAEDRTSDCSRLKEEYENAIRYVKARSQYIVETAGLLHAIHEKCKNESFQSIENKTAFALATYRLGEMVIYHNPQLACKCFNEVVKDYADVSKEDIGSRSHFYLGEGTLDGVCEEKDWSKAKIHYEQAIKNAKDPNLIAWSKARLGDIYREGNGAQQDSDKSVQLFEEILKNDANITDKSVVAWAKFWIADAHESGKGKEKDLKKSHEMWQSITQDYENSDPIAVDHARMRLQKMKDAGFVS